MLNLPVIIYWIFIIGFILSALAVLYHLWFYQLNKKTFLITTILFVGGSIFLLVINFFLANRVAWGDFNIYFNF